MRTKYKFQLYGRELQMLRFVLHPSIVSNTCMLCFGLHRPVTVNFNLCQSPCSAFLLPPWSFKSYKTTDYCFPFALTLVPLVLLSSIDGYKPQQEAIMPCHSLYSHLPTFQLFFHLALPGLDNYTQEPFPF